MTYWVKWDHNLEEDTALHILKQLKKFFFFKLQIQYFFIHHISHIYVITCSIL